MTLKPHFGALLDVEDDAVAMVARGQDMFLGGFGCESEEFAAICLMEPRQAVPHLVRVHTAAGYVRHLWRLAGQERRSGKLAEVGALCHCADLMLPVWRQAAGHIKGGPPEAWLHNCPQQCWYQGCTPYAGIPELLRSWCQTAWSQWRRRV